MGPAIGIYRAPAPDKGSLPRHIGHGAFFSAGYVAGPERGCIQNRTEGAAIPAGTECPAELSRFSVQHLPIVQSANPLALLLISTTASRILPMCLPIHGQSASL